MLQIKYFFYDDNMNTGFDGVKHCNKNKIPIYRETCGSHGPVCLTGHDVQPAELQAVESRIYKHLQIYKGSQAITLLSQN